MDPNAPAKLKARLAAEEAAKDPFAGLEQVDEATPVTDEFAGLEQVQSDEFAQLEPADDLDVRDEKTLFEDDTFRPADYLAENPKVGGEKLAKLLAVYRARQKRGLEAGKVLKAAATEGPGIVVKTAKGARDLVSRVIDLGIQPAANKLIGALIGTTPEEQARIDAEQGKTQLKAAGEIAAGTETAVTGLANLATTGVRKLLGKSPEEMTENELLDRLYVDAEFSKATKEVAEGRGDVVKAAGLDAEHLAKIGVTLDKEAIDHLSLVDPVTLVAAGGAFKVVGLGGRVLATAATKAGAEAAVTGLKKLAANAVNVAGKSIEGGARLAGKVAEKTPAKSVGFALGAAKSGTLTGGAVGAAAGEAGKRIAVETAGAIERRGAQLATVGEQLNPSFIGPRSAGLERLSSLAQFPAGKIAGSAARGAVQGGATALPLVLAADDSQTAGAILGGGIGLGAIHGTVTGTKAAVAEVVAKRYLDPHQIPFEQTNSPAYGADAALDAAHDNAIKQLPTTDQNMVNTFREAVRSQGGEIYVQDSAEYLNRVRESLQRENGGQPLTPEQEATAKLYADTHAFFDADVGGKRTVFLNSTAKGLPHDAGHLFQSLLDPTVQADLRQTVLGSYSPEQLNAFKQAYAKQIGEVDFFTKLGEEAGNAKAADEIIAENFSQLFQNTRFADLKAPRTLLQKLGQVALDSAESLGIDLKAGRTTPDLAASPSYRLQGILRNAAQDILTRTPEATPKVEDVTPAAPVEPPKAAEVRPAPEAAEITPDEVRPVTPEPPVATTPEQPATTARNIRTTREQQNDFSSRRAEETGIAEAQKLAENSPETRAVVDQIAPHLEKGTALEIEHRGIRSERGAPSPEGRTSRRATQAQGYEELARLQVENRQNAPADIVNEHQKTFVPVRFTSQGGKPTLIAMSLDKVIANVHRVVADAAANGVESLIPYPTEAGKLTDAGWRQAVTDIKAYAENQSNGYRGDGQKLVRPTEDIGVSLPAENPNYTPKPLSESAMNFANLVQGLNPPQTGRVQKGVTPGNIKGQLLAEVNRRQPMKPSVISPENVQKQGFKGFEPREVAETNPLRNELAARGVKVRELIEVTERVNVEDIASATPRPDIEFRAPVTDVIRAGFLPESKKVIDAEVTRRLEEKRKNGVAITDAERSKTRQEVEFDQRNGRLGQERRGALMFLPGGETDRATRAGFLPDARPSQPVPSAEIRSLAEKYAKSAGIDYRPSRDYAPMKPELGREIADFYEAAKSNVDDPAVQSSYRALASEVLNQYKSMVDAGYTIEPWKGEGEPYKSSADAVADIRNNKHLYFLKTEGAFGSGPDVHSTNPMLNDSGVVAGGERLMVNDVFRAVHDFFGHGKEGYQFGPRGEFNAWRSHSEMFSPEAQGALAAETLAQNSWVNFGKHLRNADGSVPAKGEAGYLPPQNRPFADQKNVVVPPELIEKARAVATDRKFLPEGQSVEEFGRALLNGTPEQFKPAMDALGGLTNGAWDLGMNLKNVGDVRVLKDLSAQASTKAKELMTAGNFSEAMPTVMKAQFFREAYEAATGTASVKTAMENGRMPAGYKPPFPEGEAPRFLPKTARGAAMAQQGYEFEITGQPGVRGVTIRHNGEVVGEIMSSNRNQSSASIDSTLVEKPHRGKGVGETAYRELLAQLKEDGVQEVRGNVVAPEPLAIRRRIFGDENTRAESVTGEDVQPVQALADLSRTKRFNEDPAKPRSDTDITYYEVTNRITPEMQFMPRQRVDAEGRPLTLEGLVDYEKLYKALTAERTAKEAAEAQNADAIAAKYAMPEDAKPTGDKPTGWITPDGEFVPLDTEYHQQFLAENSASLNEQFGTDFTETASVADRLKALNKGFVRIRQTPNGEMIVELNQNFWKGDIKQAVQDTVLSRAENADKLRLSLLDNDGQVIDSSTARLFDAEDPVAAANKALRSLKPSDVVGKRTSGPTKIQQAREFGEPTEGSEITELGPKFLPKGGTPEFNAYVDQRIKDSRKFSEALPLEFVKDDAGNYKTAYGDEPLPVTKGYDLIDTPLAKKQKGKTVAEREETLTDALSESLQQEYQEAKKNPEIEAGENWYSTFREKIQGLLGDDTKLFAELLGATSPQTAVDVNFGYALDAYNQFKKGAYDTMLEKYREGKNAFRAGELAEFSKETGKTGKKATENAFLDWWIEKHDLIPTSPKGKRFGFHSKAVLRVLDGSWLQNVKGPKTPNFTGNLTGSTFEATIDVWAMRALHRLSNAGNKGRWRIQAANETGITDRDFFIGQKAFRKAADKLGIQPDALQAILWFAEKDLWEKRGWTKAIGKKKADFNVLLEDTERTPKGLERVSKRPEPELDFGVNLDD